MILSAVGTFALIMLVLATDVEGQSRSSPANCVGLDQIPQQILDHEIEVSGQRIELEALFCRLSGKGIIFEYTEPFDLFGLLEINSKLEAFVKNKIEGEYLTYFSLSFSMHDDQVLIVLIKKGEFSETRNLKVLDVIYRESFVL